MARYVVAGTEPAERPESITASGPVLLPGEAPLLRTSERSDWRRCPWLWEVTWRRGLRTRKTPVWAWFGTAIHAALEVYYPPGIKRGKLADVLVAFHESADGETGRIWTENQGHLEDDFEEQVVDAKVLGEAMLRGYVEHYGGDRQWEVIHTEQPFQINVPHPQTGESMVVYAGTWDSLMRNRRTKDFWIWDHKTRKSFPSEGRWQFYNINDQAGSYLWVAPEVLKFLGVFKKTDKIEGLVFNALRKHLPDTRPINPETGKATNNPTKDHYLEAFEKAGIELPRKVLVKDLATMAKSAGLRVYGEPSARQPVELFHREEVFRDHHERVTQAKRVQAEAKIMSLMRSGKLDVYKVPTEECTRCPIFDYCEMNEQNPEAAEDFAKTMYRRTDPYRDHREAMTLKGVEV